MLEPQRPKEDADGLPEYVRDRPGSLEWERPTAWLLGAHVLSSLRQLILSTIHTGFDLRDWMTAEPRGIALHHEGQPRPQDQTDDGAYWFDFIADTGDAPALVYCLARALQREKLVVKDGDKTWTLPRGRMLVVGGDTAYPVATRSALCERWQAPLVWASQQKDTIRADPALPVFAVPGNHDYYDALDGFNRQFRKQVTADGVASAKGKPPPLRLPGFTREQSATYFRLHLPFEWQLWGVDLGTHPGKEKPIDTRQLQYFRGNGETPPQKLIVVTALPVAVHHAAAEGMIAPFKALGLPPVFAPHHEFGADDPPHVRKLDDKSMRLDLSGDVHLYERYFGSPRAEKDALEADRNPKAQDRKNYAAVASGLGGAFHHPLQVRDGEPARRIAPQAAWPREKRSQADIGDVLTRPRKVFQAGSVGILGALLGLLFFWLSRDAPGVLALPYLLAAGYRFTDDVAATVAHDFGATALFVLAVLGWIGFAVLIRAWTTRIRNRALHERASWSWFHRWLDGLLRRRFFVVVLHWTGANRRVVTSVIRRLVPWSLFIASIVGLFRLYDHLALDARAGTGTNIAAVVLLVAMVAFPLVTNSHWKSWRRAHTALPFMALGLVHGIAQLYAPYVWAQATYLMIVPFALLVGYWCVRPLANELLCRLGRAFVPVWLALVVGCLGTPLVLWLQRKPEGLAMWALLAWLGVCVLGVIVGGFRMKRRLAERAADMVTKEERDEFPRVKRLKWGFWMLGVLVIFPLQIVAIALLTDGANVANADTARLVLAYVAAGFGGAVFSCLWLGWYLLVCLQWGWHGNDAGSVARIDDYAELLRIKLTADTAEVWAISVDARETKHGDYPATIRLVDHFTVTNKGA